MINEYEHCLRIRDDSIGFMIASTKDKSNTYVEFDTVEEFANELRNFRRFNILYVKLLLGLAKEIIDLFESISSDKDFAGMVEDYADDYMGFSLLAIEFLRYTVATGRDMEVFKHHKDKMFLLKEGKCYAINTLVDTSVDNEIISRVLGTEYDRYNTLAKRKLEEKGSLSRDERIELTRLYIIANARIADRVVKAFKDYGHLKVDKNLDYYA